MGGTRHAKNQCANSHYSRHERGKTKWEREKARLAAGSIKNFDHCTICHKTCLEDALTCPKGDLFCRKCILEYIYAQKTQKEKQMMAYEEQKIVEKTIQLETEQKAQIDKFLAFEKLEAGIVAKPKVKSMRNPLQIKKDDVGAKLTAKRQTVLQEKDQGGGTTDSSFWCPTTLGDHVGRKIKKPSMEIHCPGCQNVLKLKKLAPVRFTRNKLDSPKDTELWMCQPCKKTLTNVTRVAVLSKCGHVLCLGCLTRFVAKDKSCVICGKVCKKKHVIFLKTGGTGFAASGTQMIATEKLKEAIQ